MNRPGPITAAGWISIPVSDRASVAIRRGSSGTPAFSSRLATRWASSACTPGHASRISAVPTSAAAGSRALRGRHVAANLGCRAGDQASSVHPIKRSDRAQRASGANQGSDT